MALRMSHFTPLARSRGPDAVLGQQFLVLGDTGFKGLAEALNVFLQRVVGLVLQAADAKCMRGQPRSAIFFENFQDFFALAETVENRRKCANVERVRSEPQKMAGDALQLSQNRSNHFRAWWSFHNQQLFDGLAISEAIADRRDVIHPVNIRRELLIRAVFRDFLNTAVQIPDHAFGADNALAVELELDAQHAMR